MAENIIMDRFRASGCYHVRVLFSKRKVLGFLFALIALPSLAVMSCGKNQTSAPSFSGYTFTGQTLVISYAMMGVASNGTVTAGVDPGSMITPTGQVRLIFTGPSGVMKSALSSDGNTFSLDNSFTSPFPLVGIGEQEIVASPTGGFRMFARQDGKVYSATSTDGAVWTQEAGVRFDGSSMGLTTITGPSVVRLSNGKYRMYFSPEITNCDQPNVSSSIYSATSSDQLNWTADSGERIGNSIDSRCKNKPVAIVESDGSITLFYHIYARAGATDPYQGMIFYSNSTDSLTFTSQTSTGVGLTSATSGGLTEGTDPSILRMPDGSMRLYFDVLLAPNGDQIYVSTGKKN